MKWILLIVMFIIVDLFILKADTAHEYLDAIAASLVALIFTYAWTHSDDPRVKRILDLF
jgi:hypothetical protein